MIVTVAVVYAIGCLDDHQQGPLPTTGPSHSPAAPGRHRLHSSVRRRDWRWSEVVRRWGEGG